MTSPSEEVQGAPPKSPTLQTPAAILIPAEEELVAGASIYVRKHGPAVLQGAYQGRFEVLYPDNTKAVVAREDILVATPSSSSLAPGVTSPRVTRLASGGALHASPTSTRRQVEFLGTSFTSPSRQTSTLSATFSLIATMVGGGVLSLPFAVAKCGWVLGLIALLGSAVVNAWTFEMLVDCSRRTGRDSYQLVAQTAGGRLGRKVTVISVFVLCWLAIVAYAVLLGDLLTPALKYVTGTAADAKPPVRREFLISGAGIFILPMCVQRNLGALRFLAFASVFSVCCVTAVLGWEALQPLGHVRDVFWLTPSGEEEHISYLPVYRMWPTDVADALYAIPMFGVSFLCHFNALPAHQELARPTRFRIRRVIFCTFCGTTILYGLIGNFGYMFAADATCGNILLNFSSNDVKALAVRCILALVMILNIPLLTLPARDAFVNILKSLRCSRSSGTQGSQSTCTGSEARSSGDMQEDSVNGSFEVQVVEESGLGNLPQPSQEEQPRSGHVSAYLAVDGTTHHEPFDTFLPKDDFFLQQHGEASELSPVTRVLCSILVLASSLGLACFVQSVLVVWAVLGSSVAFLIACILPAAFWLSISGPSSGTGLRIATMCVLLTFIGLALVCTVLAVLKLGAPACPGAVSETAAPSMFAAVAYF
mmetsp:Transcript_36436/g.66749  ORF Transcript_36436/g.66749 Transcript_36436/m.66749 type:complete len:651 (+) Transcript_36436:63-2015(+)